MGFFSWFTGDTNRSISNRDSNRGAFTVRMLAPDGRVWEESDYQGYGVFGGKDIYELLAELNGLGSDRMKGVHLLYEEGGSFEALAERGYKVPKLSESQTISYAACGFSEDCPEQGFFYGSFGDDDED